MSIFLIFVIILVFIISNINKADKKAKGSTSTQPNRSRPQQTQRNNRSSWTGQTQMNRQQMWNSGQAQTRNGQSYAQQNSRQTTRNGQGTLHGDSGSVQPRTQQGKRQPTTWNSQVASQNRQAQQPDIVQRAVANNARFEEDTTREAIETMHGHSEAEHKVEMEHSRTCQTLGKDSNNSVEAESQSMFGSVEDLIAMGYSGNLEFERDFLGEGFDMINNF